MPERGQVGVKTISKVNHRNKVRVEVQNRLSSRWLLRLRCMLVPVGVKDSDKSRLEVHSSSSRSAQQLQRKIIGAQGKYKAQYKTRLEVHISGTAGTRQTLD